MHFTDSVNSWTTQPRCGYTCPTLPLDITSILHCTSIGTYHTVLMLALDFMLSTLFPLTTTSAVDISVKYLPTSGR
jgi:hypothetical protein